MFQRREEPTGISWISRHAKYCWRVAIALSVTSSESNAKIPNKTLYCTSQTLVKHENGSISVQ